MAKEAKSEPFEQIYAHLEESVHKLEAGGLSLDESIALYEEGMALAKRCQDRLDEAELKITRLKESFAPIPRASDADVSGEPADDYEYEDEPPGDDDPFP